MKFFEIKKSFGFRKKNRHRYRNWSLVSVPDNETWFRSYTSQYPLINYPDLPENHFYLDMPPIHFTMQSSWFYICKFDLPNPPLEIVETRNLHGQTQYLRLLFTFFSVGPQAKFSPSAVAECSALTNFGLQPQAVAEAVG